MSNKIERISEEAIARASMSGVSNRPNDRGGMTAEQLKTRYSALAMLAINKLHELLDAVGDDRSESDLLSLLFTHVASEEDDAKKKSLHELLVEVVTDLYAEGGERKTAEAELSRRIDEERSDRSSAITAHNQNASAHEDIRNSIADHATSAGAHEDIRNKIETEVATRQRAISDHDGDNTAHAYILGLINELKSRIGNLSNIMNFRGVFDSLDEASKPLEGDTGPQNGDVCIVGEKEYAYRDGVWAEFGDGTENAAAISALIKALSDEATAREEGDEALDRRITDELGEEATARRDVDTWLQANIEAEAAARQAADDALAQNVSRNVKRITNIEQGLPADKFVADDGVAYVKDVPANACQYALVSQLDESVTALRVQGANYLATRTATKVGGIQYTPNSDGSFTVDGTATTTAYILLATLSLREGKYTLSGAPGSAETGGGSTSDYWMAIKTDKGSFYRASGTDTVSFEVGDASVGVEIRFCVAKDYSISNLTFYPMLVRGTSVAAYAPYKLTELAVPADIQVDDYTEVEGGGTITFVNESSTAVASEIIYQLKEVTSE